MGKKTKTAALIAAAVFLLAGCGTPMYELTNDEQDLIIQYSAYTIGKHNTFQKDGMTAAMAPPEGTTEQPSSEPETQEETQEENQPSKPSGEKNGSDEKRGGEISLAAAIGQEDGLRVSYDGYKVMKSYKVENYFSVDAEAGSRLVVMNFTIKNTSDKTINLDTLSTDSVFYGCFDGTNQIAEHESFGLNTLSSYEGKIKAGKSKKTMLIFQIPEDQAKNIKAESLSVKLNDTTYSVKI